MLFEVGKTYRRHQIHCKLGGEIKSYLPQSRGRIVCGCFQHTLDPKAPYEILVGDAPTLKQKAEMLCQQGGAIPVFIKQQKGRWEYKGLFRVKKHSTDPKEIRRKQQESGREDITCVIYLELVSEAVISDPAEPLINTCRGKFSEECLILTKPSEVKNCLATDFIRGSQPDLIPVEVRAL